MSYDIEPEDSENLPTEEVDNTEVVEEPTVEVEDEDTPEYTETEKKLFARAKKAEAEAKALKAKLVPQKEPQSTPSEKGSLTIRDLAAIKDLEVDDAEWLANYAQKMGLTMSDARKDKDAKAVLSVRAEERRTAEATATGNARRGTSKVTDDTLMDKAEAGNLPDDHESLMRIAKARLAKRAQ